LAIRALDIPGESRGHITYITYSALMMVMKREIFHKNIYHPDTDKFTTKTLIFYFFLTAIKNRLFTQSQKLFSPAKTGIYLKKIRWDF
jgi:hypothetical protein